MNNIDKIKRALSKYKLEAMLLTGEVNRRYASSFHSSAGVMLITREKAFFFTDSRYSEAAEKQISGAEVCKVSGGKKYSDYINDVISSAGILKIGFEEKIMTVSDYEKFKKSLNAEMQPAQVLMENLRAVKDQKEIEAMKKAQKITEAAFSDILGIIKEGMTELQLKAELICSLYRHGAESISFDPIVVSGPNSSMPHGKAGPKKLVRGEFITLDFGCVWGGYCSDMTRTVALGSATKEMRKVYDTVLRAQIAGIERASAGVSGKDVDFAARSVIEKAGYGEYFGHGFGHGLGMEIHESPSASPFEDKELKPGMVISAEPGIYLPGKFGVRIEDVIVISKNSVKNLTSQSKELLIIPV